MRGEESRITCGFGGPKYERISNELSVDMSITLDSFSYRTSRALISVLAVVSWSLLLKAQIQIPIGKDEFLRLALEILS